MGRFVKICGLTSAREVDWVCEMQPDAIGFIFWAPSRRAVAPQEVALWCKHVPSSIRKVGVFVDAEPEALQQVVETAGLDVVQWHGENVPDICTKLSGDCWMVSHLRGRQGADVFLPPCVDAVLVEGYSSEAPGGTGTRADWTLAKNFVSSVSVPVLLAGGLTAETVAEAVEQVNPWGLDVSSGVEGPDGKKDPARVRAFIEACRAV